MGLTGALFSSQSGLTNNSEMISVTGNNIANANTTAFKSSRINFETQISKLVRSGSAPRGELGGSNPAQIGLGSRIASVQRNFNDGPLQPTGVKTDLAIEGDGFFMVRTGQGQRFTRDGQFTLDKDFNLVRNGAVVQGYGIDEDFNVVEGVLQNVRIPIGRLSQQTENVEFDGNLNAGGDAATRGALLVGETLFSDPGATTQANAGTLLTDIYQSDGTQPFQDGDLIVIEGATRGGKEIGRAELNENNQQTITPYTFEIDTSGGGGSGEADFVGQSFGDLAEFLEDIFGIDDSFANVDGVTIDSGQLNIDGNLGQANDIELLDANFQVKRESGGSTTTTTPLTFDKQQDADGESVRTTFFGYDSLGNELTFDMSMVLEEKATGSTQWRFYAYSDDTTADAKNVGTGTLTFDANGQLVNVSDNTLNVERENQGTLSPQPINLLFDSDKASLTAFADQNPQVSMIDQDGSALGSLDDFSIDENGVIMGVFTNGDLRSLGQIPIALFSNNEGLIDEGGNLFNLSANTGVPQIVDARSNGAGRILSASLEGSNVELSQEFINLISASTGFSASSRVLSTSDRLIQELLASIR